MGDKAGIKTEPCGEDSTENIGSTDAGDYFYYDDILVMKRAPTSLRCAWRATTPTAACRVPRTASRL